MLLVVVLMTTLYAGILNTMQRRLLSLPNIINRNLLTKQAESVSDYALRIAVQQSIEYGMMAGDAGLMKWQVSYNNFKIQECNIDSIQYTFAENGNNASFRAISYVSAANMGRTLGYRAEIAFSFPLVTLLNLDYCIFLDVNQPAFNPAFNMVYDASEHGNDAEFFGNVDTRPHGSGVDGWKCASFGESSGAIDGYIRHTGNATMMVSSSFTLMAFVKINQNWGAATLYWLPPDPDDPALATNGVGWGTVRKKPSGAIWYSSGRMYYTCTTENGLTVELSTPFTPDGKWPHNKDPWYFVALTYNRGQVKGYLNGALVGTASNPLYPWYKPNAIRNKGMYIGREYYGNPQVGDTFHFMYGLIDQIGLVPRALTDGEIASYYNLVLNPATIQYIRD